jgi:hypothetical protein
MTATIQIVTDAATTAGVIDPIDPLQAEIAQFLLRRLNRMLESWANEGLLVYNTYTDQLPLTSGQASYSTAALFHGNPTDWDSGFIRLSNIDYPIEFISTDAYNAIIYKPTPGIPTDVYVATDHPNSILFFFPVPFGPMTAFLSARNLLTPTLALADDLSLRPGYEAAIIDSLAVDIGPSFGRQPNPELRDSADQKKASIKRANYVPQEMSLDLPVGRRTFNIYSGR